MNEANTATTTGAMDLPLKKPAAAKTAGRKTGPQHPQQEIKIDDRALKRIAGEAISQVEGVLGLEGNLADILKDSGDVTKGLNITVEGKKAQVNTKIIVEYGKNIPQIADTLTERLGAVLKSMAGLSVEKVAIEVVDAVSRDEYKAKYDKTAPPGTPQ